MDRPTRINRMMEWIEARVDLALKQPDDKDIAQALRAMGLLTDLYALQQTSVRMARQQKLMDDVREEHDADTRKASN